MTVQRLLAIFLVFCGASVGWSILGTSLVARSGEFDGRLRQEVAQLWGGPHRQVAPEASVWRPSTEVEVQEAKLSDGSVARTQVTKPVMRQAQAVLESTRTEVGLLLEHRRKGLLWFPTYEVRFTGVYRFRNPDAESRTLRVRVPLPAGEALYDDFALLIDGRPALAAGDISREAVGSATVGPDGVASVEVRYRSRGLGTWTYAFAPEGTAQVRDFDLTMTTNCREVDFPPGTVSPTATTVDGNGVTLRWTFANLLTGQSIGLELPQRLNPGPFASRVTFFAPVSLLFFMAVMVMLGVTSGTSLHPMHFAFLAAAFFAFHLLLAYLADQVSIHVAFAAAAGVSVFLVVSYLRLVTGMRRALFEAGGAQLVFLVLFSYAFFFEGVTGLAITVGAIVTLFVLMQMTARVSWDEVFARGLSAAAVRRTPPAE